MQRADSSERTLILGKIEGRRRRGRQRMRWLDGITYSMDVSWWWTGRPGVLRFMGSQRVRHNWANELNWKSKHHNALKCVLQDFSSESAFRIRRPKYWSFSFNISPTNEHPGLISFRMDWLDLLAVQVTLKSLLQHHSSKASIFQHLAFFMVQLSHPYMSTGKTIALTIQTFVIKVMSVLFNMLSLP